MQPDQALLGVEVFRRERECPAAPAGCLGVQSDDQRVKGWVVTRGCGNGADFEREVEVEAWHDGRAHVMLAVTVRRPERAYADDAWSARVVFTVEAGEEFATLAKEIISLPET